MFVALPTPLPGWVITAHARHRAVERGLCDRGLRLVVEQPELLYTQDATYGADRQVRVRGQWAVVINPATHVVITVLYRDRARWLATVGDAAGVALRDAC